MKHLMLVLSLLVCGSAFASSRPTCEIQGNHWYNSANLGKSYFKPMTYEECLAKGQELFDSTVEDGLQIINPLKNTLTIKSWTTQYKKVKIVHRSEDGIKTKETLVREDVVKSPVKVEVIKLKSGFRCWTKGECEPAEFED